MVKLFTDEEMAEHCKDYRTIPLGMREDIFNIDGKTSQLKLGFVTPVNINQYSISLSKFYGLDKMEYVKEYNKIYDKTAPNIKLDEEEKPLAPKPKRTRRIPKEMTEAKAMGGEDVRTIEKKLRGKRTSNVSVQTEEQTEEIDKLRFGTAY